MGRALGVDESVFGDARVVAEVVPFGLVDRMDVAVREVSQAPSAVPDAVDRLLVETPTHAYNRPRAQARQEAAGFAERPLVSHGPGVREWMDHPPGVSQPLSAVTIDTRMVHPTTVTAFDRASHASATALQRHGLRLAADSEYFVVVDRQGPLASGELERAPARGASLADLVGASHG